MFTRPSLSMKIITWAFVPSVIILVAVAWFIFYAYQQVTVQLSFKQAQEVITSRAARVGVALNTELSPPLSSVLYTAEFFLIDPDALHRALERYRSDLASFDAGRLILDNGGSVVATDPQRSELMGRDWSHKDVFSGAVRQPGRPYVSNIEALGVDGAPVLLVSLALYDPETQHNNIFVGLIAISPNSQTLFYQQLRSLGWGKANYLVDGKGRVIYHPDSSRIGVDLAGDPLVRQALGGGTTPRQMQNATGRDVIVGYAPVGSPFPWVLVSEQDIVELSSLSQPYTLLLLALLALGVIAPVVVLLVGMPRIIRPIEELTEAARRIAGGQLDQRIPVRTSDELAVLAEQFNRMSAQLQESYSLLERRVADRTREMAALNAVAAVANRSLAVEDALAAALDQTLETMGIEIGAAYQLTEESDGLHMLAQRGLSGSLCEQLGDISLAENPALQRLEVSEAATEDLPLGELRQCLQADGVRFLVSVPLVARGQLLGALYLGGYSQRPVTPEELSLLKAIGGQIGVAMETARLYVQAGEMAVTAERNRLARELHDAVTQTLFSASLIAEVLPKLWQRNPVEAQRSTEELRQLTRGALAEMRTLLLELRPSALTEGSLGDLLRQLGDAVTGRARLPVQMHIAGTRPLPPEVQVAFYRIAQEALNNAVKHSGASHLSVELLLEPLLVSMVIRDDGCGFDPARASPGHLGMEIMRERAAAIGAELAVESSLEQGTRVRLIWAGENHSSSF